MDLWTFHRYREPCLSVDAIELDRASRTVSLHQGGQTYRLAFDDAEAAAEAARELATLQDRDAPLWDILRKSAAGQGWGAIGEFLDSHSLIREGHDEASEYLAVRIRRIRECIAGTAAAALDGLSAERRAVVCAHARLLRRIAAASIAGQPFGGEADPFDARVHPNFFFGLLAIEFEYLWRASPVTLLAADALLAHLSGDASDGADLVGGETLAEGSVLYDAEDLESHLWLVARSLVASSAEDAGRLPTPPIPDLSLCAGLEFMRRTEVLTRMALSAWGQNPYVTALDALKDNYSPLVAGPFIEQYHVTRRFVEIIAPLLSKRLAAPLRKMMFRYYSEEVGHEALESTTCEALGVSQPALDRTLPLPLHFAFVDAP